MGTSATPGHMMASELVALIQSHIAENGDMPIFMYDMYDGTCDGQQFAVPDPRKVRLHPCIHDGRRSLFDIESKWGRDRIEKSKPDGERFDAIVMYVGE